MIEDKRFIRMNDAAVKQYEVAIEINQKNIDKLIIENKNFNDTLLEVKTEYFKNNVIILENEYNHDCGKRYELIIQLPKQIKCSCLIKLNEHNCKTYNIYIELYNKIYNDIPDWYYENTKYIKFGFKSFELAKEAILLELENLCLEIQKLRD